MSKQQYLYKCPNHAVNLNNMRLNNQWCDLTIRVNEKELRAHKVVLAANLKYFESMLSKDCFRESKEGVITMIDVQEANLEAFICYAYTGEILLTDSNALDLLEVANYLNEDGIKEACIEFLNKHLRIEEACRAYSFANTIDCLSLKNVAKQMILLNFTNCSQVIDYLDFNCEHLMDILSDKKTRPAEWQQGFFEGIMRWIMYDVKLRKIHLNSLLNLMDMSQLTDSHVLEYVFTTLTKHEDHDIIKDVMCHYYGCKSQKVKHHDSDQALIIIGPSGNTLSYQFYNFSKKKWSSIKTIQDGHDISYTKGVVLSDNLYYNISNSQESYLGILNPVTNQSTVLHPPNSPLRLCRYSALCACSRYLYFCGGYNDDATVSNKVLRYDPLTKSVVTLASLETKRPLAAAIFYQGCLYVLGGYISGSGYSNVVEMYEPDAKKWAPFPRMHKGRRDHAVASLDGKLYACGGQQENSVEVYDPSINSWQVVANMNKERCNFLVVAVEGRLLAMGGDKEKTIEIYDPLKNEWKIDVELSSGLQIEHPTGGLIPSSCIANVNSVFNVSPRPFRIRRPLNANKI